MTKHSDAQDIIEQLAEAAGSAKVLRDAHPAADTGGTSGAHVEFDGIRSRIDCLCAETGAVANEVLIGITAALIQRYSMSDRVSLGVLEKDGGFAVFTEVIDEDTTFQQVITDAHACLERGFANFSEVRMAAEKNGHMLGDTLSAAIDFSEGCANAEQLSQFELCFSFFYKDEMLCADVSWDAQCFAESTITVMAGRIRSLLEQAANCSALPVTEAIMCSDSERDTIINRFNDTENECPSDKTIAQMFELQAARVPDAEALVCDGRRFTFAQLNKRANMLAHTLRDKGISPNDFVALITERNAELIISILAVLKAGGAYVWVDPKFPEDRKRFIINDCSAKLLMTATADADVLAQAAGFGKEIVDIFDESNYTGSGDNLPHTAVADDTAYILYTSGTTGRPKGVMIRNNGVTVHVASIRDGRICGYVNPEYKSFLSIAAPSYAIFPFETFMSLLNGIKVVVATDEERGSVSKINELMCREGVECFVSTPSVLRMYLSDESCCDFVKALKIVMLAGEKLTGDIYDMVKRHSADCRMIGGYGTSEATLQATVHELDGTDGDPIPLGELADNAFGYVVDSNMNLMGIGVPGELCVGGIGVSKGYIGNEELNRAKFIPNPFGKGVLYKTGDMARWLPDGKLEGLGRRDNQIKIRGMRVEMEEIENVLSGVEGVSDCAVIVKKDGLLYAFYTGEPMPEEEIKAKLGEKLAVHMVPSFVIHLESFKLNVNGKLDRKALQAIDVSASGNYSQTETVMQEQLCAMFCEVLGVHEAGLDDNFFSLGGHSLRAMTLANCIYKQFGCSLSVNDIFRAPTVRELARLLDGKACYTEIPSAMDKEWYVCSSQQRRMYLINAHDDRSVAYNVPMVISYTGTIDRDRFRNALGELVERHEALRTVFGLEGGKVIQRILPADAVEIPIEECELDENDIEASVKSCMRPFDLGKAPLMRVMLSQGENCNYIVVDTHHIITDGKSANILAHELFSLYEGKRLDPLRVQYKDYSEWIAGADMSADREYWLAQITDDCTAPDLPADFARTQSGGDNWGRAEENISADMTADIGRFCRENGVTEYMLLLSALIIVLNKYSGSEDIAVGSPVSARTHADTEGTVGMFANTLIMRGYPQVDKDVGTFINEIKKMCLDAFEHQNFPYDELTAAVGHDPCNVMFVLQNNEEMNIACGS
ncbi:MAG: amino acid adenylation domain-containing protein, partial [Clostridia bacterium]|nr:amino acid adenylation domain-containing protein [Clostridia bacterium]